MKLTSYQCRDAYDRPDYERIRKASCGPFKTRLAIARRLFLDRHTNCRALDNCFEMNDGDKIVCALITLAKAEPELKAAIARDYTQSALIDGFPESWIATYERESNPLKIAA